MAHVEADKANNIIGIGSSNSPISGASTATNLDIKFDIARVKDDCFEENFQIMNK